MASTIITQLKQRNRTQAEPYIGVIDLYKKLMDDFIQSKERNVELRNEITFLRHAQGVKDVSDRNIEQQEIQRLRSRIESLQDELRPLKIHGGIVQEESLSTKLRVDLMDARVQLSETNEKLIEARSVASSLQEEKKNLISKIQQLEFRQMSNSVERDSLVSENQSILEKVMNEKLRFANHLNDLNEVLSNARKVTPSSSSIGKDEDDDDVVQAFDEVPRRKIIGPIEVHTNEINDMQSVKNAIVSCGSDGHVKVTSLTRGSLMCDFTAANIGLLCMDVDGKDQVAVGSLDGQVYVMKINSSLSLSRLSSYSSHATGKIMSVKFNQNHVISGGGLMIKSQDLISSSSSSVLRSNTSIHCLDVCGNEIVSGHLDGSVRFWDIRAQKRVSLLPSIHQNSISSIIYNKQDSNIIASSGRDNVIHIIDRRTNSSILSLTSEKYQVTSNWSKINFSCGGSFVSSGSIDGTVCVWNSVTGNVEQLLEDGTESIIAVQWMQAKEKSGRTSVGRSRLVSADKKGRIVLWGS